MADNFPDDENGQVLQRMQSNGDDLSKPRDVDFSVIFPEENSSAEFVSIIKRNFVKIRYYEVDYEEYFPLDVTATKFMTPNYDEISEIEQYLQNVSERLGGKIDGWGCFSM